MPPQSDRQQSSKKVLMQLGKIITPLTGEANGPKKQGLKELSPSKVPQKILSTLQDQISNNIIFQKSLGSQQRSRSPTLVMAGQHAQQQAANQSMNNPDMKPLEQSLGTEGLGHLDQSQSMQELLMRADLTKRRQSETGLQRQALPSNILDQKPPHQILVH